MNEVITVLTSGSGNQIAKAFIGAEYLQQRFSIGSLFNVAEEQVSDLEVKIEMTSFIRSLSSLAYLMYLNN